MELRLPTLRQLRHRGIWTALHQRLADDPDTEYLIIDSTIVRAHPDAAGAPKKGAVKTLKR